jgi:hypothetical protein
MTKTSLIATLFVLATAGAAHAGGQSGSIGVGAEIQLSGLNGVSLNYDAGKFHVGGFVGYNDPPGGNNSSFQTGGRFFYHVHSTAMADFGLGGQLGIESCPQNNAPVGCQGNMMGRATDVFLEPAFQIRLFVASNVALSFTGGIVIGVVDAQSVAIAGQFTGIAGVHYYFF